jgi:glycosyltransferase involved in cell wall biosynthesis
MNEPAKEPVVSIILAAYNAGRFLKATVDSVLQQTLRDWELIAVDDGSTDSTLEQLHQYSDERMRVVQQNHVGYATALNAGLRLARGAYIAFLDQDDLWVKSKLAKHIELMDGHPEVDLTFSWSRFINEAGQDIGLHPLRWRGAISFRQLLADFVIGTTSSIVVRRKELDQTGGFDPELPMYCDMDLCLRVALYRPDNIHAISEELTLYRRHSGQMSKDWRGMRQDWERMLEKVRRVATEDTTAVEQQANSNMNRYFAYLAYESVEFRQALRLLWEGFKQSPGAFLTDSRNWLATAACLAGLTLPGFIHRGLERLAGFRRVAAP